MKHLIEKLKAATGPDHQLFAEVMRDGLGLAHYHDREFIQKVLAFVKVGAWTDAALALVAEVLPTVHGSEPSDGWRVGIERERLAIDGRWLWVAWVRKHARDPIEGEHTSPAIAILIALITAIDKQNTETAT